MKRGRSHLTMCLSEQGRKADGRFHVVTGVIITDKRERERKKNEI